MSKKDNIQKTGGQFLLDPINDTSIFTREDFTSEHVEIYKMVMDFDKERVQSQKEKIEKYDPNLSIELLKELGGLGLLGIDIPEKYDGIDLDKITSAIVAEALVQSPSFAVTWAVQTGIGSLPIVWFGTDEQKKKYLPKISSGEFVCAYGLTEPSSGSDATQAKTSAKLTEDKKHYILNGEKVFITNGGIADVFVVFAQVDGNKFSAFILEKGTEGFSIGREENKLGMKGSSTAQLIFQDAKVPAENLLKEAKAVALKIAEKSMLSTIGIKESINRSFEIGMSEGILFERRIFNALFSTDDKKEGMSAFIDKRTPKFEDK